MSDNVNTSAATQEPVFVSPSDLSVNFTKKQMVFLGLQNTVAMSGVIIVPILCGLNVSVTLFCAGIGTLIYQSSTRASSRPSWAVPLPSSPR